MKNNYQKICLITGANSGIGKEIAIGLAKSGAHVIMVCRNLERGQAALEEIKILSGTNSIELLIADLSSQTEIRALAETIYNHYLVLDVIINNAGLVLPRKSFSVDGIEMTLATNYLAPFLLTNLLITLLKKSASPRIINISSAIHKWAKIDLNDLQYERRKYHFMKAYAQSKLLMNIMSFELARRLSDTRITVNCIHPGAVKTQLGSNDNHNIMLKIADKIIKFFFISPQQAAKSPIYLALSPDMENITGKYFVKNTAAPSSPITYDPVLAAQVWEISENLVSSYRTINKNPIASDGASYSING